MALGVGLSSSSSCGSPQSSVSCAMRAGQQRETGQHRAESSSSKTTWTRQTPLVLPELPGQPHMAFGLVGADIASTTMSRAQLASEDLPAR
jgi:hypothetical protein